MTWWRFDGIGSADTAIAGGSSIKLTHFAVGDGNGSEVTPSATQTALTREVDRLTLNSVKYTDATRQIIAVEAIIPADHGGYWIREAGIFAQDGTLVAISQMPVAYKPGKSEGGSSTQIVRIMLAVSNADAISITVSSNAATATESFVEEKLKAHEKSRNHPNAPLKEKGFTQLSSDVDSDSEALAANTKGGGCRL